MPTASPRFGYPDPTPAEPGFAISRSASRVPTSVSRRADLAAVALLVSTVALLSWVRLWHRPGLGDWDIMTFYLPWYAHVGESLRSLDVPGWNPRIFSGMPFAGDPQSGWMYWPVMVSFTFLPATTAFKVVITFHLLLGATSTYVLARLLRLAALGSTGAAVAFTFSQNVGATECCTNHVQLLPWLPLALVGIELSYRAVGTSARLASLCLTAVALSQIMAAWIGQGAYNGSLIIGSYLVVRGAAFGYGALRTRLRRTAADGLVVFSLGLSLAAAGLFPRLDAVRYTFLGSPEYLGRHFDPDRGWDWSRVAEALVRYQPERQPYYVGGAMLVCALAGLPLLGRRRPLLYFLGLTVVVMVLPARPTPLHDLFYLLPRFRGLHLHDPGRVLAVLPLGVAILAGAGVDAFARVRGARLPMAISALVALTLIAAMWSSANWQLATITKVGAGGTALILAGSLLAHRGQYADVMGRYAAIGLILLLLADPAALIVGREIVAQADAQASEAVRQSADATDTGGAGEFLRGRLQAGERFRYVGYLDPDDPLWQAHEHFAEREVLPLLANNRAMRLGLDDLQGYNPAQVERYRRLMTALNGLERDYHEALVYASGLRSPLLDMLNVRYVLVPARVLPDQLEMVRLIETMPTVYLDERVRVLENPAALPRAWVVHDVRVMSDAKALVALSDASVDPRLTALLARDAPALDALPAGATDAVEITSYENDDVRLDVNLASRGMLVLADSYDPNWRVYVDGKRSDLYAVNTVLRGVEVPAGAHEVEFRYDPAALRAGLAVSGLAALGVIGVVSRALWTWLGADRRREWVRTHRKGVWTRVSGEP